MYTGAHSFIHVVLYIFQYSIFIDLLKVGWWEWPFFCLLLSLNLSATWYHLEIFTIRIRIIKKKKDLVFTQFSLFLILCVCVYYTKMSRGEGHFDYFLFCWHFFICLFGIYKWEQHSSSLFRIFKCQTG